MLYSTSFKIPKTGNSSRRTPEKLPSQRRSEPSCHVWSSIHGRAKHVCVLNHEGDFRVTVTLYKLRITYLQTPLVYLALPSGCDHSNSQTPSVREFID